MSVTFDFGSPVEGAELNFWLTETRNGISDEFWDGSETRFIPGPDRSAILEWLLIAVSMLIFNTDADCVYMVTMNPNLPHSALSKYLKIVDIFRESGFSACEREPLYGTRSWLMERTVVYQGPVDRLGNEL